MKPLKTDQILLKNFAATIKELQDENAILKRRLQITAQRYRTLLMAFLKATGAPQSEIDFAKNIDEEMNKFNQ